VSGVILRLKIVKAATGEEDLGDTEDDEGFPYGAKVLRELVLPWARACRIVCAASYFASVRTDAAAWFSFHWCGEDCHQRIPKGIPFSCVTVE
jgi:hypothetical protein